jgi:hypothetical protein
MAGIHPAFLTFEDFYAEPTNNPFRTTDGDIVTGIARINAGWRLSSRPPNAKKVHFNILADFVAPVGAVSIFIQGGDLPTGSFKCPMGSRSFRVCPDDRQPITGRPLPT